MTFQVKSESFRLSLAIGVLFFLSSCATTTGSDRAEKTTTKMESVDSEIREAITQIDETGTSLQSLIDPGQSDMKDAFETYSENVAKMDELGKNLIKHTDEMSARGKDYFDEWKKQGDNYTNPQIREASEKRGAALNTVFRNISDSSIGIKGSFIAYMNDIREVQTFLSNDLTNKGIASITPVAQKAIRDGASLKSAVVPVLAALDSARSELAQGGSN